MEKFSIEEIRNRFDKDVERFSNLDTGQVATIDAVLSLELITAAAARIIPEATTILDVGCGAGNYTLKMLQKLPGLACTLVDLSMPMLKKAEERVREVTPATVQILQGDIRTLVLPNQHFDIILAGAVLHHLRDDNDWETTFQKLFNLLKPGGCLMISDLVIQDAPELHSLIWEKYGEYLSSIGGDVYRDHVFAYIEKEDSPRSLTYQLGLMKKCGFRTVEVLHKHLCFAAFGGIK
jgi:tRNA (cmo5U34)-methyltransferase